MKFSDTILLNDEINFIWRFFMNYLLPVQKQNIFCCEQNENTIDSTTKNQSLVCKFLLNNKEVKKFEEIINLETKHKPARDQAKRINDCINCLFLNTALETAQVIKNAEYKKLDALVGNFGCHLTASFVQEAVRQPSLLDKANKIEETECIEPEDLSQNMCTLIRLRLLCMVNDNILKKIEGKNREVPITKIKPILDKIAYQIAPLFKPKKIPKEIEPIPIEKISNNFLSNIFGRTFSKDEIELAQKDVQTLSVQFQKNGIELKKMVDAVFTLIEELQNEEAKNAAQYVRELSLKLDPNNERTSLIQRILGKAFEVTNDMGIVSLPLMYNTEAVIGSFKGIILVKNKLLLCGEKREGMKEQKIFIQWPENRLLSQKEIDSLPDNEPLLVLEGDLSTDKPIAELIIKKGLDNIVNAINACLPQYSDKTLSIKDQQALEDLKAFAERKEDAALFDLDHVYCANAKEERGAL
jgi:hypothetical protein